MVTFIATTKLICKRYRDIRTIPIIAILGACSLQESSTRGDLPQISARQIAVMLQSDDEWNSLLSYPRELIKAPTGNYYVIDWNPPRIVVYSHGGEYLFSFGQEGSGPSDLRSPRIISIDTTKLCLYDSGNRSLKEFSLNGSFLRSHKLPESSHIMTTKFVNLDSITYVAIWRESRDIGNERHFRAGATSYNANGEPFAKVSSRFFPQYTIARYGEGASSAVSIPFSGDVTVLLNEGSRSIFVCDGIRSRIDCYNLHGELMRTIAVRIPRERITVKKREEVESAWEQDTAQLPSILLESQKHRKNALRIPDFMAAWDITLLDDSGRFWLSKPQIPFGRESATRSFYVIDESGVVVALAELPSFHPETVVF